MSLTDPLLKDLKGHILESMKLGEDVSIDDTHSILLPMCQVIEEILRKGLQHNVHSAFGMTKRDYWSWIEKLDETSTGLENGFKRAVKSVSDNTSVLTSQGRGRLFIRHAIQNKCLHVPIESIVRMKCNDGIYDSDSIVGNEILGEILLSLLYQLGRLNFDLNVNNSSFLEDTWQLPLYVEYELVPCLDLGICLGHVSGRSVVIKVEEGSVAGEDNKIEVGDVIHEAFGVCIHGWRKGKVTALLRQHRGLPVSLKVVKGHYSNGCIFPGVVPLLRRLQLDVDELQEQFQAAVESDNQDSKPSLLHIGGQSVNYLGSVSVGNCGDVSRIEHAVSAVATQARVPVSVRLITGEIGVQTLLETNRKVILSHSYTEISSCGRRNDLPLYFAYIAGDTSCTISSHFTCYVFQAHTEDKSREILLTLADGFHRTHWAV